jgi:SAM-dependent methyltransferase
MSDGPTRQGDPGVRGRDDWDSHWSAYAESAGRNPAQAFRRRIILRQLSAGGEPRRLLDIGSGTGDLAAAVVERFPGVEVLGLELSAEGVALSRVVAPTAEFLQCDLSVPVAPPPGRAGWATHAVCSEVLEHVDDPVAVLRHGRSFMAPRCLLVATVPGGPMTAYDRHIGHRRHFRPPDLARILDSAGFEVLVAGGAGFPWFNVYRLALRALGDRVTHVAGSDHPPLMARAAMAAVAAVLRVNTRVAARGWQVVATGRLRAPAHAAEPHAPA